MMRCAKCGEENPSQAKFCYQCGVSLLLNCKKCGLELPSNARFCFACGASVASPAAHPGFASPNSYTPHQITSGFSWLLSLLGYSYLFGKRTQEARELANRANELARQYRERGWVAWTNYLLGQIGSTEEEADTGATLGAFREAMHEAQALQMRPLLARSELGMGKLYWRLRDSEIACEHLNKAVAHFREMQMPHWLHEAEAQLRVLELN